MMMIVVLWAAWTAALVGAPVGQGGADSAVAVRPVRFFSPGTGSTVIEGTSEIRLSGLAATSAATTRYRVDVSVFDSSGLQLLQSGWDRELPTGAAHAAGATAMESFHFAAAPGRYRITVRATSADGAALEHAMEVGAFAARPLISDLLLATAAREADDTVTTAPGEVRRGRWVLRTAPVPHLTFTDAGLTYYAELYPWAGFAGGEARLGLEVVTESGRSLVRVAPQVLRIAASGGVARGTMDLAGLPEGNYRLRATVTLGDSSATVEGAFSMGPVRVPVAAAPSVAVAAGPVGPFDGLNELALDSLYAPLVLLQRDNERGVYENLTADGKRRYLEEFWHRRDPTPQTADNPLRDAFYRGVRHANQTFREGGAAQIPGWRTDRGRIYLKYGEPNEAYRRPQAQPRGFEVWSYTQGRARYYAFRDQTAFGHYLLIGTNDVDETAYDHNQPESWITPLVCLSPGNCDAQMAMELTHFIQR
jgi:GWxTD domain-containing protein